MVLRILFTYCYASFVEVEIVYFYKYLGVFFNSLKMLKYGNRRSVDILFLYQ